jgi:acetyl-CoA C-acetyltransferase
VQGRGFFDHSLVPVHDVIGEVLLARDEAIRPNTTAADLARLKPAFAGIGETGFDAIVLRRYPHLESIAHLHTSGTSSGIVDGACAVLMGSAAYGKRNDLRPRARIRASASCASEPLLSLGGPMPATERVLARAGMSIGDVDLFEINEAFARPLAMRHFDARSRVSVNGGAIELGHQLSATGAILLSRRGGSERRTRGQR